MAKSKATEWLTEEKLIVLRGWARNGLTDEQIAFNMGINVSTIYEYKNRYPEIAEALKESKEEADLAVENALYKKALSGSEASMFFWLQNRQSARWKDRRNISIGGEESKTITVKLVDMSKDEE